MLVPVVGLSLSETLQLKTASLANIFESSPLASITSGKFSIIDQVFNDKGRSSGQLYGNLTTLTHPIEEHKIDGVLLGIAAPDITAIKKQLLSALQSGKSSCYVRVPVKTADNQIRYHDGIIHFPKSLLEDKKDAEQRLFQTPIACSYHQNAATIHDAESGLRDFLTNDLQEYCVFCPCYAGDAILNVQENKVTDKAVTAYITQDRDVVINRLKILAEENDSFNILPLISKLQDTGVLTIEELETLITDGISLAENDLDWLKTDLQVMKERFATIPKDVSISFSPTPCSEALMREDAQADVSLVSELGWNRVAFIGTSLGGAQALHAAQALARGHTDMSVDFVLLHNTFSSADAAVEDTTRNWIETGEKKGAAQAANILAPLAGAVGECARQLAHDQIVLDQQKDQKNQDLGCNGLNNCKNLEEVAKCEQFSNTAFIIVSAEHDEFMTTSARTDSGHVNQAQRLVNVLQSQAAKTCQHIVHAGAKHNTALADKDTATGAVRDMIKKLATEYTPTA